MKDVLILLGSKSDLKITENGVETLRELGIPFSLRIASAHRTPDHVESIVSEFENQDGSVIICVAGMSAHLGGVVAANTLLPVLGVPVYNEKTAGFDAMLSISQMPGGIPVACMGLSKAGFTNACILAAQIVSTRKRDLKQKLKDMRSAMTESVLEDDKNCRIDG